MTIAFDYTLLIQFFNVLILMILLNIFLFKPVLRALGKRESTIRSLFGKVDGARQEAESMEKSYEEVMKEKKKPILEHRDTTLAEAHSASTGIIEQARKELSDELTRLRSQIQTDSKNVFDALKGDVERLGTEAAQKILRRSL